ncbi:hypothetical protein [Clostridium fallax]|uniref:Uncharacterized protein n=1 Tax=Clostridium fallax TaxID=1533 RepID=A0A1M4U5U9_9CLOT|nr:hypothetical protein [Clostridium fallax]SHE52065.1 hypothetical protein SAMN05443638_10450 [Clostridium fallax]SQB06093.1 Uncharacterised protein [Clostridium fallax]
MDRDIRSSMIKTEHEGIKKTIYITAKDIPLYKKLEQYAKENDMSVYTLISNAIESFVEERIDDTKLDNIEVTAIREAEDNIFPIFEKEKFKGKLIFEKEIKERQENQSTEYKTKRVELYKKLNGSIVTKTVFGSYRDLGVKKVLNEENGYILNYNDLETLGRELKQFKVGVFRNGFDFSMVNIFKEAAREIVIKYNED